MYSAVLLYPWTSARGTTSWEVCSTET